VRNYSGNSPTGLSYEAAVDLYMPDAIWQPPVTNAAFALQDGTTLPLKFQLYKEDGTLLTDVQNVWMEVEGVTSWRLGDGRDNLRFDPRTSTYLANFKTKDFHPEDGGTYMAIVHDGCADELWLGAISFVVNTSSGTGRGNR
jgi:hypothetical protein